MGLYREKDSIHSICKDTTVYQYIAFLDVIVKKSDKGSLLFFAAKEGDDLKDTAIEATTRLKQALMNEREAKLRLQGDVEKLREHIHELNRQLKVAKEAEESLKGSLRALEEVTAKMERDKLQQQTHEVRVMGLFSLDLKFMANVDL